jgi:hypothetical protein
MKKEKEIKIDPLSFYRGVEKALSEVAIEQHADHSNLVTMQYWVESRLNEATLIVNSLVEGEELDKIQTKAH